MRDVHTPRHAADPDPDELPTPDDIVFGVVCLGRHCGVHAVAFESLAAS